MNLLYAPYTPFFLTLMVVGLGVIYTNSQIVELKDVIRKESQSLHEAFGQVAAAPQPDSRGAGLEPGPTGSNGNTP